MIRYTRYACALLVFGAVSSAYGMNALKPHYYPWRPIYRNTPYSMQFTTYFEKGIGAAKAFDSDNNSTNVLQIFQCDQNAIAAIAGFSPESKAGKLGIPIELDNGRRGHLCVTGEFDHVWSVGLSARYTFPHNVSFGAYLPAYKMQLRDVCWQDLTCDVTDQDRLVKDRLTNDIIDNAKEYGCDLDLLCWERTGVGDLVLMFEWLRAFPQGKPLLKNVDLDARIGLSLPTGLKQDEDKLLAIPFGFDGAVALIFAGGLRVTFGDCVRTGFDIELDHAFDSSRLRRIKTNPRQTDLLFFQKTETHIDWGMLQQINLYFELFKIWKGFSAKVNYQFLKHGDNEIGVFGNCHSSIIANTAVALQEYTMHNFIMSASYDFAEHLSPDAKCKPYLSLFAKVPVNGQRSIQETTVGFIASIDF